MNIFIKARFALIALGCILLSTLAYADEDYLEGGHYEVLTEAQPVQTGDKIEVLELFWYRCPHCYTLEPEIHNWLKSKPENAEFVSLPAILGPRWSLHARMFYTLEALGLSESLHGALFEAIHGQRKPINSLEQFAEWVAANGSDEQSVRDTFESFAVETKTNFSSIMTKRYGINGVPAMIVDGKYRTSSSLAGGHEELFKVINFLIEKAQSERSSS